MMKKYAKMILPVLLFVALMPLATGSAAETEAPRAESVGPYNCFPTCSETDGRFLVVPGSERETLTGQEIEVQVVAPADAESLEIGIFDGDTGNTDAGGDQHWDAGTTPLEFTLYADPVADGSGFEVIDAYDGATMPDNDWFTISLSTGPNARAPSGHYFYRLRVRMVDVGTAASSAFKLRSNGILLIRRQPFSFIATFNSYADLEIIYPEFPDLDPTNYDGSFHFFLDVPEELEELALWDGDLDRGKHDGTEQDTDDLDTPNDRLPLWAVEDVRFEGVALADNGTTADPPDDNKSDWYLRSPSVQYELIVPEGPVYVNENPSGNREWEQFKVSTEPFDIAAMDHHADSLPPGTYEVQLTGMDMGNLNAWRFPATLVCVDEVGNPCEPLRPYVVGDTVWYDGDRDGVQDANEDGISGVTVNLLDSNGNVMETTTTDADGTYRFEVEFGTYTVQIAGDNFAAGGVLENLTSTTGGEEQTRGVTLDYDFGYVYDSPGGASGSLGDRVWLDVNGDGVQDAGEPGIDGAVVNLYYDFDGDGDLDLIASDTTASLGPLGAGYYSFDQLDDGTYVVTVNTATLPGDLLQTYDLDGVLDSSTTVTLASGETRDDVDFGYQDEVCCPCLGSIGDTVWNDENGNGVQDNGEQGIPDVGVMLTFGDYVIMTTTDENGEYLFKNLDPGTYVVSVDETTLGSLTEATYDYDGVDNTPHMATVELAEGETNLEVDFGYQELELAPVKPILECVADNQDGTYTAYFGYLNENDFLVTIPVGDENKFSPTPQDRGQPTTFEAGRTPYWPDAAFGVEFDGSNLVWTLDGRTSTASSTSTPCSHHVFLEKEWYDQNGNLLDQPPAELTGDFTIEASSDVGTAICSYDDEMNLVCSYDNDPPALDDNGLWVPVGTDYEVTEYGLPEGWSAVAGVGTFTQGDGYCVGGREGMEKYCTHTVENVEDTFCEATDDCATFTFLGAVEDGGETTLTWEITNDCDKGLSHVAFSLPDDVVALGYEEEGDTYTSAATSRSYTVENPGGNPFRSIKFEDDSDDGVKNGESDIFEYTLNSSDYDPSDPIQVQMKTGGGTYTITLTPNDC